jgi:hypothetical protein
MADTDNNAPAAKAPKVKTVAEDMDSRRIFANVAEVTAYLGSAAQDFSDFGSQTFAAPGVDGNGNFDPEVYTDSMDIMVGLLRNKSKVKAVVVAPIPKIDRLLGLDADAYTAIPATNRNWIEKILHKEMAHVAVRALREAEDVSTVIDQMPTTVEGYLEPGRGDSGIMEAFSELYKQINSTLAAKIPVWAKARLIKSELKKALESRAYAAEYYPSLEDYKGQSLFVAALNLGIGAAKRKGLDPTIFQRWLDTRDQATLTASDDEDELDIGALTDMVLAEDSTDAKTDSTDADTATDTNSDADTTA